MNMRHEKISPANFNPRTLPQMSIYNYNLYTYTAQYIPAKKKKVNLIRKVNKIVLKGNKRNAFAILYTL